MNKPPLEAPETTAETILLVNDDVIVRMSLSEYLRQCGYRVIEAANADEAITVLKDPKVTVEVVFSDLHIPGTLDGFGLSRWVRTNHPHVEVIFAATVDRAADAAGDICAEGPLRKPYEPQALVDRIKRLRATRDRQR